MRDTAQSDHTDDVDTARRSDRHEAGASSFAYDCTLALVQSRRISRETAREAIVAAHPGFRLLRTLQLESCI